MGVDVFVKDFDEFRHDLVTFERGEQASIHINRGFRLFGCSRKRNSQTRVLRFSRPVDDASHHRDFHLLHASVGLFPDRHLFPQVSLNLFGHFLEKSAGRAPTAGTGRDLRGEAADAERLQNLLRYPDFFRAISAGSGGKRDPNRVANAFLKQNGHSRAGGDDTFAPMPASVNPRCSGYSQRAANMR